ncbi:hypothetical protein PSTT_10822 [Puccinia striiformis]|uniref:Uncharacterized protein n=1 Tax=Puccinia striiformis TaxID=27350 RepID=A0A2S4V2N5_9BASI|nr:hypothetical protein PSTT_10822 [Puccinia striiformis]
MQFRFNRVPSYDQGETSNSSSSIHRTTSRDLRKARSTPILRINEGGVTDARNPPRRPSAVSRLNSIAEAVEGPTVLTRPAASTLTLGRAAWPMAVGHPGSHFLNKALVHSEPINLKRQAQSQQISA